MTEVFGVLNVTPDSFSDGGEHDTVDAALAHARRLVADGADWIDVGGESTAPGVAEITSGEEQRRIIPVIRELAAEGIRVSVDTFRAATAVAAVEAGARLINDVYGRDPDMPAAVRASGADYLIMHSFGAPTTPARYDDVVADVAAELARRVDALVAAGIDPERLAVDPGLGFSKQPAENWALIDGLDAIAALGRPVLVGASRKRFVRALVGAERVDLDAATAAISLRAAQLGAWAVRVHDVRSTRAALAVHDAMTAAGAGTPLAVLETTAR